MNRETEQHFSEVPYIDKPRSKFKRTFDHKTTWDNSQLVPIFLDQDILPGDTVKIDMSMVVRMATPLYPVMDNCYLDVYFFFIPNRLLWKHWQAFWGENENAWYQTVEYEVPQVYTSTANQNTVFKPKTIADYMGLPLNTAGLSVSALPFRAYVKVWNDWFRDENLQQEVPYATNDTNVTTLYGTDESVINANAYKGGTPLLKVNRFHDYFSSCLPAPQKGNDVYLPLGLRAPVKTYSDNIEYETEHNIAMKLKSQGNWINVNKTLYASMNPASSTTGDTVIDNNQSNQSIGSKVGVYPVNLWADLTSATSATINQLRQAFAIQRFYEAQARGGSRYIEFLKNIFGVTSPDARLQRSEYLGGKRIPINMTQVLQTSATDSTSPQGNTGAYSQTADYDEYFTKSFTEHGILLGLACCRTDHTFNQGIERGWSRKKWLDYYVPQFANLSEQAVLAKEIYAQGTGDDETVFGYQEAWADYRYKPSIVTGAMRTTYAQSLDAWHYADHYTSLPVLGPDWIKEPKENVDRTLAVSSTVENQFIGDFYFDCTYVRPMPLYSVPGLIDHF